MSKKAVSRRSFLRAAMIASGAVLASCAPQATVEPAPTSEEAKPAESGPSTEPVTIMFWWHHGGAIGEAVQAVITKFEEMNPNVTIEGLQGGEGEKLEAALAGGVGPDSWDSDMSTIQWVLRGAIQPMDTYLTSSIVKVDDYPQKPAMVWEGKTYAIPAVESGMENALVWNKKLFAEAGLDPEKPPTTPAEVEEYNAKLTKFDDAGNITQLGFGTLDSSGGMFPNWPTGWGIDLFDEGTNKVNFTSPEFIEAGRLDRQNGADERPGQDGRLL